MSVYDVWKAGELIREGNVTEAMKYIANAGKEETDVNKRGNISCSSPEIKTNGDEVSAEVR